MPNQEITSITIAASTHQAGTPAVDILNGGRDVRVWPTGHSGALIMMSMGDWLILSAAVEAAIRENAKVVA